MSLENLDAIEAAWKDGEFNDEMDAVRNAQRTIPGLIAELRASRNALQRIVDERERNPQAAPGMCDECVRPIAEHLPWCAAAIAREALSTVNDMREEEK